MLNTAYVGRTLPPTEPHVVTSEHLAAFAAALGDTDPAHRGAEAIASPTYLVALTLPAADRFFDDPDFGMDFSRVLHREQRFQHVRPVRAGDELSVVLGVESIKTVAGNDILSLRAEVTDGGGAVVSTVWTTLFVKGED